MIAIFKSCPRATRPGTEIAINSDWVVAITPDEDSESCFITVDGDSTPRYKVQGNFYDVVRKLTKQ